MAMNKYMHPRNIYKKPPDFKRMALEYPEFRDYLKQDIGGKVTFDFQNAKALRVLSCTLLKKDFGLFVDIPLNRLIPTIPLRLNYILWLEDLLNLTGKKEDFRGIDIGTGASCIYPLLAAKKNSWTMVATEVDDESLVYAKSNVERNSLQHLISVIQVDENTVFKGIVGNDSFDFCMCNPPFFGSTQELNPQSKARKPDRPKPKNSFCASLSEVVVKGGEVDFIAKIVNESKELGTQIRVYSTMIGHKRSLPQVKKLLREANVKSFCDTQFSQGNTTRWGLAWTFREEFDLKTCPDPVRQLSKQKPKDPFIYKVPLEKPTENSLRVICEGLSTVFEELKMSVEELSKRKTNVRYRVRAFSNTWSNQRKKRREMLKNSNVSVDSAGNSSSDNSLVSEESIGSPGKRGRDSTDCLNGTLVKKLKIADSEEDVFFKFTVGVIFYNSDVYLELNCSEDGGNREYLHQILQHIKNSLKISEGV